MNKDCSNCTGSKPVEGEECPLRYELKEFDLYRLFQVTSRVAENCKHYEKGDPDY